MSKWSINGQRHQSLCDKPPCLSILSLPFTKSWHIPPVIVELSLNCFSCVFPRPSPPILSPLPALFCILLVSIYSSYTFRPTCHTASVELSASCLKLFFIPVPCSASVLCHTWSYHWTQSSDKTRTVQEHEFIVGFCHVTAKLGHVLPWHQSLLILVQFYRVVMEVTRLTNVFVLCGSVKIQLKCQYVRLFTFVCWHDATDTSQRNSSVHETLTITVCMLLCRGVAASSVETWQKSPNTPLVLSGQVTDFLLYNAGWIYPLHSLWPSCCLLCFIVQLLVPLQRFYTDNASDSVEFHHVQTGLL